MSELKIGRMVLGEVSTNCYFIYKEGSGVAICVDPAAYGADIYNKLKQSGMTVSAIFLTHGHFDHTGGAEELKRLSGAKIYASELEKQICEDTRKNLSAITGRAFTVEADYYLKDGSIIEINGIKAKLISTPGHTAGSCCYYFEDDAILISGDTLFEMSVGRTDLPTGSSTELKRSITDKLFVLPDNVKVYPGHGDKTNIEYEKKNNPLV